MTVYIRPISYLLNNLLNISLASALILTISLSLSAQAAEPLNKVVAVVNDAVITQSELDKRIELVRKQKINLSAEQVLQELIKEQLQLEKAEQAGLTITDDKLDEMVAAIAQQNHFTLSQFKNIIEQEGMHFDDYKTHLKTQQIIGYLRQRAIVDKIEVSDKEVTQFLNSANMAALEGVQNNQYRIGHILIALTENPTELEIKQAHKKATELLKNLNKNDATHTDAFKDLGWRKTNDIPSFFANIVPQMSLNEIKGPIQSESGFHIIKLIDKHAPNSPLTKDVAEQKKQIIQIIKNRKATEKFNNWLDKLYTEAYIQNYLTQPQDNPQTDAQTP